MLVWLIALPLAGSLCAWAGERVRPGSARGAALITAAAQLGVTGVVLASVPGAGPEGLTSRLGSATSYLALRLDGLAAPLVGLTALLGVVAVLASWRVEMRPGSHFALLLALQAAVTAVFVADDLILFYVAWEAVLIPMFFLIGVWGHEQRRHAAMKFFVYTFAGSALMLIGILIVWLSSGATSIPAAIEFFQGSGAMSARGLEPVSPAVRTLVFWLLAAGFAVKIPVWPLHTWLPDAHVEAPTAGSIMLAGVLLKMGGYGFLRLGLPLVPEVAKAAAPTLSALGMIAIVYGALMAFAQTDLKRLVAYSSVAHMGFVVVAIAVGTPLALAAAMLSMVAHGVTAALLFLLVGVLYDRTHTRDIARFGGLLRTIPGWGAAFLFGCLASLGLPGLAGFPGELLTTLEAFGAYGWWVVVIAVGVVLAGAYNLRAARSVVHGPQIEEWDGLSDLEPREALAAALLALPVVVLGAWPSLVSGIMQPVLSAISGRG